MSTENMKIKWWLMTSSFPNLNWAKQILLENGTAEVLDCDGKFHKFETYEQSKYWLLEDEFTAYEKLDAEDEQEYGIILSEISPPLTEQFYVKKT